jgi:hypothetical protein
MSQETVRKERQRQLDEDARFVFTHPSGRRFVAALLDNCGLYALSPDLGKRSVAVGLRDKAIMLDPKIWSAIDAEIVARRIAPPKPPVEVEDD